MLGFRQRPSFKDVLGYIEEGEPVNLPLPNRRASAYVQSHFYLDDLPQSTEPLDENPRPHSELGARIEDDFVSADEGYQGRPFPQMRRPSFLGPGPETNSESGPDEAFRRDGFDAPRPPPAAPSSSVSGRLGEAALRGGEAIIAAGTARGAGCGTLRVPQRRASCSASGAASAASNHRQARRRRAAHHQGRAARAGGRASSSSRHRAIRGGAGRGRDGRDHAAAGRDGRSRRGNGRLCSSRDGRRRGPLGMGAMGGAYQGARYMLGGNGGDAASSSGGEFQDLRTLNNMQQGTLQERFSVQQPRVQQPMVSRLNSSEDDTPIRRPRPQRAEPSFNELRREALAREPEAA